MRRWAVALGAALGAGVGCTNEPPSPALFHIEPAEPDTTDDLVAVIDAAALDFEGKPVTHRVRWTSDDGDDPVDGETLPADRTARGETWTATVIASDGRDDGAPSAASVLVGNAVPEIAEVAISPGAPDTSTRLTCVYDASDGDGDALDAAYEWQVNGGVRAKSETLDTSKFTEGDDVKCVVVLSDGEASTTAESPVVTILDAPPEIDDLDLVPTKPSRGTPVDAIVSASDFDDDPIVLQYRWYVEDLRVDTDSRLDRFSFHRGDVIRVEVTPTDGTREGPMVASADVLVGNALPEVTYLAMSPAEAVPGDVVTVVYDPVVDYDGDSVTVTKAWTVNGAARTNPGDSFDTTGLKRGDVVAFSLEGADASGRGKAASVAVTLGNRAPTVASATVSPSILTEWTTASCTAGKTTDPDGDKVTTAVAWYVNDRRVSTSATLAASSFKRGDDVYCVLTPNDGTVDGDAIASPPETVVNAAPSTPVYEVIYESATTWDTLSCTVSTVSSDPDGDSVTYTYQWSLDGAVISTDADIVAEAEGTYTCSGEASDGTDTTDATADAVTVSAYAYAGAVSGVASGRIDGYATSLGTFAQRGDLADVTGDGKPDLIVSTTSRGAYLFSGTLASASYSSARGYATCASTTGCAASVLGVDLDDDGTENLLVGHTADATGATGGGAVWLLATAPSGAVTLSTSTARRLYSSTASAALGSSSTHGDFDGDGVEDVFLGAPGAATVYGVQGGALWSSSQSVTAVADFTLTGTAGTSFGTVIEADLDSDGDGYDDLLVATSTAGGKVYLFHGPGTSSATLSSADATFAGTSTTAAFGTAMTGGDLDQSGADEVILGSTSAGVAYVWLDPGSGAYTPTYAAATISGGTTAGSLGAALAAGDFDNDGADDLTVGAPGSGTGATGGRVLMFLGPNVTGTLGTTTADLDATSSTSSDGLGTFVRMRDLDDDGECDLAIGVPGLDSAGTNYGGVYLIEGD